MDIASCKQPPYTRVGPVCVVCAVHACTAAFLKRVGYKRRFDAIVRSLADRNIPQVNKIN
jgi:hypothetical protein